MRTLQQCFRPAFLISFIASVGVCSLLWAHTSGGQLRFIENKGLWPAEYTCAADIPGGKLLAGPQGFHLTIWHPADIAQLHPHGKKNNTAHTHAGWQPAKPHRLRGHRLAIQFIESDSQAALTPEYEHQLSGVHHYFYGNNPGRWATNCRAYSQWHSTEIWNGITFNLYSDSLGNPKTDWIIAPHANVQHIRLKYQGAEGINRTADGKLIIVLSTGEMVEQIPAAWQITKTGRKPVKCSYQLRPLPAGATEVSFQLSEDYEPAYQLVIDPVLVFSTYSGSTADNWGFTATYDAQGNLYGGGVAFPYQVYTNNTTGIGNYVTTPGAFQTGFNGGERDIAITKFSGDGSRMIYSTYLGGDGSDSPHSLITNSKNELYIMGTTSSTNFPIAGGSYDNSYNGGSYDIVVACLDSTGSQLLGATYIGGIGTDGFNIEGNTGFPNALNYYYADEYRGEIILDDTESPIIASCTNSSNFPVANAAWSKNGNVIDAVVFSLNRNLSTLKWSGKIGGAQNDAAYGLTLAKNNIYVCGGTESPDLGAGYIGRFQSRFQGGAADGFLVSISADGANLLGYTFLGTSSFDQIMLTQSDSSGNVYVTGYTEGTIPITPGKWGQANGKQFIGKFSNDLTRLEWLTTFGTGRPKPDITFNAFLVDICGNIYLSGWGGLQVVRSGALVVIGNTQGLITTPDALQPTTDGADFYLLALAPEANRLLYATFFGGSSEEHVDGGTSRFDKNGIIYQAVCAGCGNLDDFPTTAGAFSNTNNSKNCNMGVFKLDFQLAKPVLADFKLPTVSCPPVTVNFQNLSVNATDGYLWEFGDGTTGTDVNPTHTFNAPGNYTIKLTAANANACNKVDIKQLVLKVPVKPKAAVNLTPVVCDTKVIFENTSQDATSFFWDFGDGTTSDTLSPVHQYPDTGTYNFTLIARNSNSPCADTLRQQLRIKPRPVGNFSFVTKPCVDTVSFRSIRNIDTLAVRWDFGDGTGSQDTSPVHVYPGPGNYLITYVLDPQGACPLILKDTVRIIDKSTADFEAITECSRQVQFRNTSRNSVQHFWRLPNGTVSTADSIAFTFAAAGVYPITLISEPNTRCQDSIVKWIRVPQLPNINVEIEQAACNSLVTFKVKGTEFTTLKWDFGDGNQADTGTVVQHLYSAPGEYTVTVIANKDSLCPQVITKKLNVVLPSQAKISLTPVVCDTVIQFQNASVNAQNYLWHFSDGTQSTFFEPKHTFIPGTNHYAVLITEPYSVCPDTDTVFFYIPRIVKAAFEAEQDSCTRYVQLRVIGNQITQWIWQWADNPTQYVNERLLIRQFPEMGSYAVILIANPDSACPDTLIDTLQVGYQIQAAFNLIDSTCNAVVFAENRTISGSNYRWLVDGQTVSFERSPVIDLRRPGRYEVSLIVEGGRPCGDTISESITVLPPPDPRLQVNALVCLGLLQFSNQTPATVRARWFVNTNFITDSTVLNWPIPLPDEPTPLIWLEITDSNGCVDTLFYQYNRGDESAYWLFIPNVFTPNGDGIHDVFLPSGPAAQCLENMIIYDRWGRVMFETQNFSRGWDGTFQGKEAEAGGYVYVLKAGTIERSGIFNLVR